MKIEEKDILKFNRDYRPAYIPPKEEGYYMTIRCGLGGIYTSLNEWKNGQWQMCVLDASQVIAYSEELISEEEVNQWCEELKRKYKDGHRK